MWQFPVSLLLGIVFLMAVLYYGRIQKPNTFLGILSEKRTAIWLTAVISLLIAIEGTLGFTLHRTPVFIVLLLFYLFCLGLTVVKGYIRKASWSFILNHAGLFIILWSSVFGALDVTRASMVIYPEQPCHVAHTNEGKLIPLPFNVTLDEFQVQYYADSVSPKQYTSHISLDGEKMETSVNAPCMKSGYRIYQSGYDTQEGQYSVLLFVKDPWWYGVMSGMLILAAGSILLMRNRWPKKYLLPAALLITILFSFITVEKINFGTLMPALRSFWFVPHLLIYMLAYSLMAVAVLMALANLYCKKTIWDGIISNLLRTSSALIIIGMLCGSVWAQQAWGDCWSWDAKENWAAVTWLITLIYLHIPHTNKRTSILVLLLAFLALQITWYGVNYLPSAQNSLHTYNT